LFAVIFFVCVKLVAVNLFISDSGDQADARYMASTTFWGPPVRKAFMFSAVEDINRLRAFRVTLARCDVMTMLLALNSGYNFLQFFHIIFIQTHLP
jgi:hypothetical protein